MAFQGFPTWSTTAASNGNADPAVNWAEGMAPSAVNDSSRGGMASLAKWRDDLYGITAGLATGGTSTAYTVTTNATYDTAAHLSGAIFSIIPHATSGASPTLAVDGLTARALNFSTGVAVPTGALIASTPYLVRYVHASTEFIVIGPSREVLASLDIIGGTQETAIATDDTLPLYDLSATANRRMLVSDVLKVINALTADASPDSAADYVATYDASATAAKKVLLSNLPSSLPRGYIDGCKLTNGTDATNDINIAAGKCRDSTDTVDIIVPAITGKQLDANWAAGASAGMRNSAAGITDTTYHIWAVRTTASSTGDIYAHTSTTAATVLTALQAESGGSSYAYLRHIMSIVRTGGSIKAFIQLQNGFVQWVVPVNETVSSAFTTTQTNYVLTVPTGVDGMLVDCTVTGGTSNGAQRLNYLTGHPSTTLGQPGTAGVPTDPVDGSAHSDIAAVTTRMFRPCDSSAQIAVRAGATSTQHDIYTFGFIHPRGKDS